MGTNFMLLLVLQVWYETVFAYSLFDHLDQTIGPVYFSNIVIRHGQREAENELPGLQLSYKANNPERDSMTTKLGMKRLFDMGSFLNKRYRHLIPTNGMFDSRLASVLTIENTELIISARCFLAGMFPPKRDELWAPAGFLPVPFRTLNEFEDKYFLVNFHCKKWAKEYANFQKTEEFAKFSGKYSWVFEECKRVYNTTFGYTNPMALAHEIIEVTPWVEDPLLPVSANERHFLENLEEPAIANFYPFSTTIKRLWTGPLLEKMLDDMMAAIESKPLPTKRFAVYSGSGKTLVTFLFGLGIEGALKNPPKFGSAVLVELRVASNNTAFVTFVFHNSYDLNDEPQLLISSLCPHPCRLDTLIGSTKPLMPLDGVDECNED